MGLRPVRVERAPKPEGGKGGRSEGMLLGALREFHSERVCKLWERGKEGNGVREGEGKTSNAPIMRNKKERDKMTCSNRSTLRAVHECNI